MSNEAFTSQDVEEASASMSGLKKWEKRQEEHDAQQAETHRLYVLEVNSVIAHRGAIESAMFQQVELNRDNNAHYVEVTKRSLEIQERQTVALEQIAHTLTRLVNKVES